MYLVYKTSRLRAGSRTALQSTITMGKRVQLLLVLFVLGCNLTKHVTSQTYQDCLIKQTRCFNKCDSHHLKARCYKSCRYTYNICVDDVDILMYWETRGW
ncbi:hypothetical protein ScPMuIL_017906 [Solemya velum]